MPRCAVSIASATPRPMRQRCMRYPIVASQSTAASSHGSMRASGSETTCAAEYAMRSKRGAAGGCQAARPLSVYGSRRPSAVGSFRVRLIAAPRSQGQRRHVDPATVLPRRERGLDELHALRTLGQRELPGRVLHDVADELLPLDLEAVVPGLRVGHELPLVEEVHRLLDVGIPDGPRRRDTRLDPAVVEA